MISLMLVFGLILCTDGGEEASSNEYDTYNAEECKRIRRPWHLLTTEERDLYVSGLLKLRENGNGNIYKDELISIGSVHDDDYAPFIHKTSSYLFWHGYLVWELESRIRNLGGKYRCFGMPYWDFTLESGREYNPRIFEDGSIGGDGDPNNFWTVNEYSWKPTIKEYWVPNNCIGTNDKYPICSLKRSLRKDFIMPSAKEIGDLIINNPNFIDFQTSYSHTSGSAIHLIDNNPSEMDIFPQSYEPIWYMFHSMIQMNQGLWVDCNEYDLININNLNEYSQAYSPFCNSYGSCNGKYINEWTQWELDDPMHFGGWLIDQKWSYIHNNNLTIRKLYMLPQWNIIYDLNNGNGFYKQSGLNEYCKGKINNNWFILNENESDNNQKQNYIHQNKIQMNVGSYLNGSIVLIIIILIGFIIYYCLFQTPKEIKIYQSQNEYIYGSV